MTLSSLEKQIGDAAVQAFTQDLRNSINDALSRHGIVNSWGNSQQRHSFVNNTVQDFSETIRKHALTKFLNTYKQLLQEFPQLAHESAEQLGENQ